MSNNDLLRYAKQIILKNVGIVGQKKISSTKVLIVGMGGLGCPVALYLSNLGIKNIGIIDHDKVDFSNLNRQILFNIKDIGKFKVTQAKKFLQKVNNKIKINTYKIRIIEKNIQNILNKYDIVCDCSDNFTTRYLINDFCLKNKKILISTAINKFEAHVFNFNFSKKIPCYRCFMPEIPAQEDKCDAEGILPTVAGIAGTLQANEVVKSILDKKSDLVGKMIVFNTLNLNFRKIKLTRNTNCIPDCSKR
ncbi:HesA/MoeB/ThiF family protein [Pelagibacteraceae bacterium]|nr:HesA/MoeB/ThiF family protein [Pelagibacteraceae bacterium]